ncbi:MAG: alpha-galactosidase [Lactobacillus sp.]|nr:alpha-galactosidase [Lactobacillus sp.]
MKINFSENEYWYGGYVVDGMKMPLDANSSATIDLTINNSLNQAVPFFVSSKGRYLWRDAGFKAIFENGIIELPDDVIVAGGFSSLRGAYLAAMKKHFPFHHETPAKELFEKPIYNSWIELTFFQNQQAIEQYAVDILNNGLPAGVLMIDDGWSNSYGDWQFHSGHFPSPKKMINRLKDMGYQVMLWVCPFVTPDTVKYREARDKKLLVTNKNGEPFITKWWNGYSAVLDMTNPKACEWLDGQLNDLVKLGVDGFKFDAGDSIYYDRENVTFAKATPNEQSIAWAKFGEKYAFNEYRVTFKAGGRPILQRLCDKNHAWGENGIVSLIPDTLAQGIMGYPYSCPDMIGGGEYLNFQECSDNLDQELFVRHSEIACLMPAMQFSAAPYRVLDKIHFRAIQKAIAIRKVYSKDILALVDHAAKTGEPIVRYMAYEFPDSGAEKIIDQFMLGSQFLVAPIVVKGQYTRKVFLPKGMWRTNDNEELMGNDDFVILQSDFGKPIILNRC